MRKIYYLACLVPVGLGVNLITEYGTQWDLSGKFHMPTTLLAPDGKHYPDGSEIDFVTLALVNRGIEQEAWLVAIGVLLVLFTALTRAVVRACRTQKAFDCELRRIREMNRYQQRS